MGNRCDYGLKNMFSSKVLSKRFKGQLYMKLVQPVGFRLWTLRLRKSEET